MLDKKKAEQEISLHLNVLSRMAIGRDVNVKLTKKGTFCDVQTGEISIKEDLSEDIEVLIGLGFHELGHAIATSYIDYAQEFNVPPEDAEGVHSQLNSLEDYRIENRIAVLYPNSEYYLKKTARWWRLDYAQKQYVSDMTGTPSYVLHLLLDNIDLCKFVKKEPRKVIRELRAELKAKNFEKYPSTRSLFPLAYDAYKRLKQFTTNSYGGNFSLTNKFESGRTDKFESGRTGKGRKKHPVFEEIKDGDIITTTQPGPKETNDGTPALVKFMEATKKLSEEKEGEKSKLIPREQKPPSYTQQTEYVRPYDPTVVKITEPKFGARGGITNPQYSIEEGNKIAKKLIQELKFKDGNRHRLEDGELDVGAVIENMQENRGRLSDFNVFTDTTPLIHDHCVAIMIDMSGSMGRAKIQNARSAALMLATALEEMSVPHTIRGFWAEHGILEIKDEIIKDFDEKLNMNKIEFMGGDGDVNRDSSSIRHIMNIMNSERGKKIIFVISDGKPNHSDGTNDERHFNANSFMDMYFLAREAEKDGISIIGIGITPEAMTFIGATYLKGFAITKIEELPEKLMKIYLEESAGFRNWKSMLL